MPTPHVSIIVPAYNAARTIDEALLSVFDQTFTDFEVIVVDDGSTDDTAAQVTRWGDRVTLVRQANSGPGAARNTGLARCRGRYVAFLDADDVWLPDKLRMQVNYFAAYPGTGLLHTATCPPGAVDHSASNRPVVFSAPRESFCEIFQTDIDINTLTVMVPRAVVEELGGFDERREIHVEDWDLWLRIAAKYPVGYLTYPTAIRRPGGGMSSDIEATFRGQAAVIRKVAEGAMAGDLRPCCTRLGIRRRWHRFHWELGYARLRAGNRAGARQAFARAIAIDPLHPSSYAQFAATFLSGRLVSAVRQWRTRRAERGGRPSTAQQPAPSVVQTSLIHDTVFRRSRRAVVSAAHALDDGVSRLRRGERQVILFEAASPMSYAIFKPVHERLKRDPRLEFWFTATGQAWKPETLFERVGITENVLPAPDAAWMKVDACINTDFWDSTWLHRRTRRVHLFHGVAGKYGLDAPVELAPIVATFDRLLFPNEDRLGRYIQAGLVRPDSPAACLVGYPKLDCLVDGSIDPAAILGQLELERDRPIVLYAPTWSPHSSLNRFGEELIERLVASGFTALVKLHDRSYDMAHRGSGGIDWAARLSRFRGHRFVRVITDADATPYLSIAHAMVTDHSSIGFEYAVLNRPIVVIDCPELLANARIAGSKVTDLRSAAEVVPDAASVPEAVFRQLEDPSLHGEARLRLARTFFYRPGTATDRAVTVIYDTLGIAAPVRQANEEATQAATVLTTARG